MKRLFILAAALCLSACGYVSPDAGEEAVLVQKPWFFGSGGVVDTPVRTGSNVVAASTDAVMVNVAPQTFEVSFEDLMPSNGIPLDFSTIVRVQVTDSVALVRDWRGGATYVQNDVTMHDGWFWWNIYPQYQNLVRQSVKRFDMNALALDGNAIDAVDRDVQTRLAAYIKETGIPVKLLGVTIGRANPPEPIKHQRIETAAQTQREQTMAAAKRAEDARKAAELSRAEADNAYRQQMSLSPEQFVDLQRIEMQKEACKRNTCIFGEAGGVLVARQ